MKGTLKASHWLVAAFLLFGLALRLLPLVSDPLHQDEALYGFWGRLISAGRDPWLATVPVDKPPLVPYLIAGSQAVFGVSAFTARMAGLAASLLAVALTFSLARRLYSDNVVAIVAAGVMALTPYPVLFGATAFTDPILVAWWLASCCAALGRRWGSAGLLLGLAFASKQHAVLLSPLVLGLGSMRWQGPRGKRCAASLRFALGLASVVGIVFAWDDIRVARGAAAGFWDQGVDSYGGLRLIWSTELKSRLLEWAGWGRHLLGWPWLGWLVLAAVVGLLWRDLTRQRQTRAALADLALSTFLLFYLFFHYLLAFPVWDRYLLPLVPVLGLLLGRVLSVGWRAIHDQGRAPSRILNSGAGALLIVVLVGTGLAAANGRVPVGGDHGAYDGLQEVMRFLRALPVGTVLYDRWLSWHYDFYLFDAYVYRAGFPSPGWLSADAAAFYDGRPRYLVLPSWESSTRLDRALALNGLALSPVLTTHRRDATVSFVVYEVGAGD